MDPKIKRYQKDFDHSYCLGVYPTLELLDHRPDVVLSVLIHSSGSSNQGVQKLQKLCEELGIRMEENDRLVDKLAQRGNTYAIGVFRKFPDSLDPRRNHLVLVNPSSMGNLGTIIRSMLGFGCRDLAIIEPAADPFHPKVIRASMGAAFQIQLQPFKTFTDYWGTHANHNLYLFMTDGKITLPEITLDPPYALVFGDEAAGLGKEYHQYGSSVKIPQSDAIDSLNLALSVGISLYQSWLLEHQG
jgi:TrmH family RNA methyltransferase